jgi:hypothetical protein
LSLFERNFRRLEGIIGRPLPDLESGVVYRLQADGFMDLVVEVLSPCPVTGAQVLSLCHYFVQNGDLCADPEMGVLAASVREFGRRVWLGSWASGGDAHESGERRSARRGLAGAVAGAAAPGAMA